jgi:hypothetical protein
VVLQLVLEPMEVTLTHTHSQLARERGIVSVFKLILWAASTLCIEVTVVIC